MNTISIINLAKKCKMALDKADTFKRGRNKGRPKNAHEIIDGKSLRQWHSIYARAYNWLLKHGVKESVLRGL